MRTLALFKSHYSLSKSCLTYAKAGESAENEPASIVDLAVEAGLKQCFVVDDALSGALEAETNLKASNIALCFGLRLTVVPNIEDKNEESLEKESKIVVLAKNFLGYKSLIKISTKASTDGFYYRPRIDYSNLKSLFSDNLQLIIPFYDSFIYQNSFTFSQIVPDFGNLDPYFFVESNGLPIDKHLSGKVASFSDKIVPAKSIYYKNREDFKAYMTLRCSGKRTTLDKPQIDSLTSDEFCYESWRIQNGL